MKLFIILYAGSQIGGSWPTTYTDLEACSKRAAEASTILPIAKRDMNFVAKLKENGVVDLSKLEFKCEQRIIDRKTIEL